MKFDVQFPFSVRQAVEVASAIARSVNADLRFAREMLTTDKATTPSVLRIASNGSAKNGTCEVRVRFEGGTDVTVSLFNTVTLLESWRQGPAEDWVVFRATARFYKLDPSYRRTEKSKAEMEFSAEDLLRLQESPLGWHHPHVHSVDQLTGDVGIFWDNASQDGYVEVDPETNQSGHHTLYDRVSYCVLVQDDRERAVAEARKILATYGA